MAKHRREPPKNKNQLQAPALLKKIKQEQIKNMIEFIHEHRLWSKVNENDNTNLTEILNEIQFGLQNYDQK